MACSRFLFRSDMCYCAIFLHYGKFISFVCLMMLRIVDFLMNSWSVRKPKVLCKESVISVTSFYFKHTSFECQIAGERMILSGLHD